MTAIDVHRQANRSFAVSLRLCVGWLFVTAVASLSHATEPKSDPNALALIFADDHLSNVLELHKQATQSPPEERFLLLRDAVFPPGRIAIRFDFDFSPAHVSDPIAEAYGFSDPWSRWRGPHDASRFSRGGELLSPVIALITVAQQLDKLEEIEALVGSRSAHDGHEEELLAVQLLIAIARKDIDTAREKLHSFDGLVGSRGIDVRQLRLARRDGIAYFIAQADSAAAPTLLGRVELGQLPINPGYLRLIVHTGGEGHETIILFKKFKIYAERIQNVIR